MNRLHNFEFEGKEYPLTLSMRAANIMAARYGNVYAAADAIKLGAKDEYENITHALEALNAQAVEYMRLIDGTDGNRLPGELAVRMSLHDANNARVAIIEAINLSLTATVDVEQDEKNAETTQE